MLKKLTVRNLAVIENAEAEFSPSLTVITGETGAGKSVLTGAIELALGAKADGAMVRDGATEAEIEAEFEDVVVRRTITASGRSRAWINDESVAIAELRALGARLVDLHGPRANQELLDEGYQRRTLDEYGAIKSLAAYREKWTEWKKLADAISELSGAGDVALEIDMLSFQTNELESAALSEDDETLGERHAAAAHGAEIAEAANEITEVLGGDRGVAETLSRLQGRIASITRHLPLAAEWAQAAEELTIGAQALSRKVEETARTMTRGEEDLDELDKRLTLVNRLKRKYAKPDVKGLLELFAAKRARLDELMNRDARIEELTALKAKAESALHVEGERLSREREVAAKKLARAITGELRDLGFAKAKLTVELKRVEPTPEGVDEVVYMFEPNPGEAARPLADIASSGEIARVMLAIKSTVACGSGTLVFDEIDANIGGEIGAVVGEKLRKVAAARQVVAITHLPQSAVFGEKHLVVSKSVAGGRTKSTIAEARGEERILEIERMLGGENLTSVTRKHAEELLGLSR